MLKKLLFPLPYQKMKELLKIITGIFAEEDAEKKKQLIIYLQQLLLGKISSIKKEKERKRYLALLDLLKEGKIKQMQEKIHSYLKKDKSRFPWWIFLIILLLLLITGFFLFKLKIF